MKDEERSAAQCELGLVSVMPASASITRESTISEASCVDGAVRIRKDQKNAYGEEVSMLDITANLNRESRQGRHRLT